MFQKTWVRIPELYIGWTFFHFNLMQKLKFFTVQFTQCQKFARGQLSLLLFLPWLQHHPTEALSPANNSSILKYI